jgi:CSLREA domain-containing protein
MKTNFKSVFNVFTLIALLISLAGSAVFVTPTYADSAITVTTTTDELNTNGSCSLREALNNANNNAATYPDCAAASGADTITVPAGTYTLSIAGAGEDANATGDLDITDAVTINGTSAASTIIQAGSNNANGIDRVFHIIGGAGVVNIGNVTIANGQCAGTSCSGGGIFNDGVTLNVTNSVFTGNYAGSNVYGGGGIFNNTSHALNVINSTFTNNFANQQGGAIYTVLLHTQREQQHDHQ